MTETAYPCRFMRGGTSKALMFRLDDLPADRAEWDPIFIGALGSPDPYGRQMNGMGGGISSLSKVCVVGPSAREDADVDYTFGQVMVDRPYVDYRGNCGNMSSAIGPFALDYGIIAAGGNSGLVRIFNTNTGKIIHAAFPMQDGKPVYEGELEIPGVSGTGAPIRLDFLQPGGATTGKLLPTGSPRGTVMHEGREIECSMIDAANACVFVRASDVGLTGTELPGELDAMPELLEQLQVIRRQASVAMGIAPDIETAAVTMTVPYVAMVSSPTDFVTLDGQTLRADAYDVNLRFISSGQPHRALPLTASLCSAVAARITGSLVHACLREGAPDTGPVRLGMPSGVLTVAADVVQQDGVCTARSGSFYRTARPLFDGQVWSQT